MARGFMPGVRVKNITPGSNDPSIIPVGVVCHIAVSWSDSLHDFFEHGSGIESTFYVQSDGDIEQYRSIFYEADAQSAGNSFTYNGRRCGFVSIETEGVGVGRWTPAQVASIIRIIRWVHSQNGFPFRKPVAFNKPGVGYHRLFREWNPNSHSCPGDDRVIQFNNQILPALNSGGDGQIDVPENDTNRMDPDNYFIGAYGPHVTWLGKRLVAHGFNKHHDGDGYQPGPRFTKYDRANVADFQHAQGWEGSDADGYPGPVTLKRLAAAPDHDAPKPKPRPKPKPKIVRLDELVRAARRDGARPQGGTTKGSADDVKFVELALFREGLLDRRWARDGSFGTATRSAYSAWQRRLGYRGKDADGIPGIASLRALAKGHGFTARVS